VNANLKEGIRKRFIELVICLSLMFVILCCYWLCSKKMDRKIQTIEDDYSWMFQVDSAEVLDGELVLDGFAFALEEDATGDSFEIVLREVTTGKNTFLKTKYIERQDVNNYFSCEYDYAQSGFVARINEKRINLDQNSYEILLRVFGMKTAYRTGTYLVEGKLFYADPQTFSSLDVEGTDIEKIIREGILRVYRPDYGMYVYQYSGDLYWIAENERSFSNGDMFVEYQLDTTQIQKLPQERIDNHWNWDNIGFVFSVEELVEMDTGKYRVAKKKLPTEYAIEKIWTGKSSNGWVWKQFFRPYYTMKQ